MKKFNSFEIPEYMRALFLQDFNGTPRLEKTKVPLPANGEVLIKMEYSPINPSDWAFIRGLYSSKKKLPVIPGFEGSGTVVATGNDFFSKRLLGKKVACFAPIDGNGTWAEFMLTSYKQVVPLKPEVSLEQGSMLLVNPLSVMAMINNAKKGKHKAIANTAAASALGQMMNKVCLQQGIDLVNIVRREEQENLLRKQGANYVVNSSSQDYHRDLSKLFAKLQVTLAFDAVSGRTTFDLLEAMPDGGVVDIYGALAEEPISANPASIIFGKKKIQGFWLSEWLADQNILKILSTFRSIQKLIGEGYEIKINKCLVLEEVENGISDYISEMTKGKMLVQPWRESIQS